MSGGTGPKMMHCHVCGELIPKMGRNQRYCRTCAVEVAAKKEKQRYEATRKLTEVGEWYELNTLDTPENIQICLNCPLPECRMESAGCERGKRRAEE